MLHFKQLSNSSAPPPRRKTSLPQNIKTLKIVKYRALTGAEGQTSIIKSTGCLSHLFCITPLPHNFQAYPIGRIPQLPPTTHPAARLSAGTCASSFPLSALKGESRVRSRAFCWVWFWGVYSHFQISSLYVKAGLLGMPLLDRTWAGLGLGQVEESLVCRNQPRLAVTLFLGTVNSLLSVTSVTFLQHLCLLVELS